MRKLSEKFLRTQMTSQEQTKSPPDADAVIHQLTHPFNRGIGCLLLCALQFVKWLKRISWAVTGTDNIKLSEMPVLFASNHTSHVDTHVIMDVLPKDIRSHTAVAAAFDHFADADGKSLHKRVIQFLVASLWNAFSIERRKSPLRSIRTMQSLLEKNWSIVIYPEGTRSRTGDIARFKPGLAVVAKRSNCPVIPICVKGGLTVLPEAMYIPKHGKISISFGKPLYFVESDTSESFMERVEQSVRAMHAES